MKKFQATKKSNQVLLGVLLILFALVVLFSPNTPLNFLSDGIVLAFGFVGFWFFLPFIVVASLIIITRIKLPIKTKNLLWGIFLIVFVLGILLSAIDNHLTFKTATDEFNSIDKTNGFLNTRLGGGYVGFVIAGALNSLISPLGTIILSSVLLLLALVIIFWKQLKAFVAFLKKPRPKRVKKSNEPKTEVVSNETPVIETPKESILEFHQAPIESNLKKAHFNFVGSTNPLPKESEVKVEEKPVEAIVEESPVEVEEKVDEPIIEEAAPQNVVTQELPKENVENIDPLHRPQPKAKLMTNYIYPSMDLLKMRENNNDYATNEAACSERAQLINQTFQDFKVDASIVGYTIGPSVTRYDVKMGQYSTVSSVSRYIDDISIRLNGLRVRFETIVAGKSTSGLEIPNKIRTSVGLRESIDQIPNDPDHIRYIPFGKNISGELISADLTKFPHMLVSGTTGSGKTIFIHSVILTLLMRNKPEELKILLIDPKKVELNFYKEIPHLLCPNISDSRKAYNAMNKLVDEMERRYNLFQDNCVRDIEGFNEFAKANNIQPLPYIAIFVDEYADLADTCKEIREPVVRLAQKARAAGIHLVLATQRPSVNVIDGIIKGNIATRVALLSASATDSITIIGEGGAEKLLGNGDMLIESSLLSTCGRPRVQGCYVAVSEIMAVCDFLRNTYGPQYDSYFLNLEDKPVEKPEDNIDIAPTEKGLSDDELYEMIKEQIFKFEYASISYITRSFSVGFTRAGKLFRRLQNEGLVAMQGDSRGCKVLVHQEPNQEQQIGSIEQSTFIKDE